MSSTCVVAALPVKTEPTTEIDIKEEPLDVQQFEQQQPSSAAVTAATRLLQHQLSGIKDTLKASKTEPRPEDIAAAKAEAKKDQEEGEIDDDDAATTTTTKKEGKCGKEQQPDVEGPDDVASGRAARMPVWQVHLRL